MKSFLKLGLTAIAITLFFNAFTVTETKAQGNAQLNEILKRMETNRNTMQTLRSNVTMVKYDSVLKESDTLQGKTIYLPTKGRDALVRIDWTKPEEILSVVNGKYVLYRPRLKQAIVGNVKEAKGSGKANGALSFMNMSKDQLKANYTIKYLGQENVSGGTPTWRLELTPIAATNFKTAELWVDGNGMPVQAKIIETNNDTTTVLLSGFEKNATINRSQFEVKLPKDTKIIKG